MTTNSSLGPFVRLEIRSAVRPAHWLALVGTLLVGVLTSILLPKMPTTVYLFFKKALLLGNWTDMIIANDLFAIYTIIFWLGVFDLLRIYVIPYEERYLDIFLSKPLTRAQYILTRSAPTFVVLWLMGVVISVGYWIKIRLINGPQDLHAGVFFGSALVTVAVPLVLLALVNLLFLSLKDTYHAILASFVIWMIPVLPTSVFIYRPDAIAAKEWVRNIVVFPISTLWFPATTPVVAAVLVPLCLGLVALLAWGAGQWLERRDVM